MLERLAEVGRGLFEPALVYGTHAEPHQRKRHGFAIVDIAGEPLAHGPQPSNLQVPVRVERGLGENEESDRLDPAAPQAACKSHGLVAMCVRAFVITGQARECRQDVQARDHVPSGVGRTPDRDALQGKLLRPREVTGEPASSAAPANRGAGERRVGLRLAQSLVEPIEALAQVTANEPVVPQLGRKRQRQVGLVGEGPRQRGVQVVALGVEYRKALLLLLR